MRGSVSSEIPKMLLRLACLLLFFMIFTVQHAASNCTSTSLNISKHIIFEDSRKDGGLKFLDAWIGKDEVAVQSLEHSRIKRQPGIILNAVNRIRGRVRSGVRKATSLIFPSFVNTYEDKYEEAKKDISEHENLGDTFQKNNKKKIPQNEAISDVFKKQTPSPLQRVVGNVQNKIRTVLTWAFRGINSDDEEINNGEKENPKHEISEDNGAKQTSEPTTKYPIPSIYEKITIGKKKVTPNTTIDKTNVTPNTIINNTQVTTNTNINETRVTPNTTINENTVVQSKNLIQDFKESVYRMEPKFYQATFRKVIDLTEAKNGKEVGFSFVQSTLCLHMVLMLMSPEFTPEARQQLEQAANFSATEKEQYYILKTMMARLPSSNSGLLLRWATHLLLRSEEKVSREFRTRARDTVGMDVVSIADDTNEQIVDKMNQMVERDTSGALHESFYPDDIEGEVETLLNIAVYFRPDFRGTVTVLNKEMDFRNAPTGPFLQHPMFRVNDVIGYAEVPAWDAEVLDIPYATSNLSLVVVAPRSPLNIKSLAQLVPGVNVDTLVRELPRKRLEVTLPNFTLRMTTVLSNKLQQMGMPAIIKNSTISDGLGSGSKDNGLQLTHATQRFMFWSQSGINAFKEDGQEWDPKPESSVVMDHPYIFMVKWNDAVIMSGNWVGL